MLCRSDRASPFRDGERGLCRLAVILSNDGVLHNPLTTAQARPHPCLSAVKPGTASETPVPLTEVLVSREREIIEAALEACRGRIFGSSGAAAKLGIPRSTLESRI